MKALISPNESFDLRWISLWDNDTPVYSEILDCQRVAEVEPDNKIFDVASPLHWVSCPDDCRADEWYFKDGQCFIKPQNAPKPEGA
jgi:hypothetical protein